jgi:hypothetical protein
VAAESAVAGAGSSHPIEGHEKEMALPYCTHWSPRQKRMCVPSRILLLQIVPVDKSDNH